MLLTLVKPQCNLPHYLLLRRLKQTCKSNLSRASRRSLRWALDFLAVSHPTCWNTRWHRSFLIITLSNWKIEDLISQSSFPIKKVKYGANKNQSATEDMIYHRLIDGRNSSNLDCYLVFNLHQLYALLSHFINLCGALIHISSSRIVRMYHWHDTIFYLRVHTGWSCRGELIALAGRAIASWRTKFYSC